MEEDTEQLHNSKVPPQLLPHLYKKGQSGNPGGRPKNTLKEYAKQKIAQMSEEEREEFLNGIDKRIIWEMAEGKAKQDLEANVKATINVIIPDTVAKSFNINGTNTEASGDNTQQEQIQGS